MSTLTLLRHGQAAFGSNHYDRLSDLGHQQARATGEFFRARGWRFDRCYAGPRQRQQLTATLACPEFEGQLLEEDRLDEFAEGSHILAAAEARTGTPVHSDSSMDKKARLRVYLEQIELWASGSETIEGAPTAKAFCQSVDDWLKDATADPASGQQLLATTSAGVIAAVLCQVLGLHERHIADFMRVTGNASLTTIVFSSGRFALQDFNGSGHLPKKLLSGI